MLLIGAGELLIAFWSVLRLDRDGGSAPSGASRLVFQVGVATDEITPVVANTLGRDIRAAVAFTLVSTVVTGCSKPDKFDGAVRPFLHLSVGRRRVGAETMSSADVDQDAVFPQNGHTSSFIELSWLLSSGTAGNRVGLRPGRRRSGHKTRPVARSRRTLFLLAKSTRPARTNSRTSSRSYRIFRPTR